MPTKSLWKEEGLVAGQCWCLHQQRLVLKSTAVHKHCSPLSEFVIIKCRPVHLAREFTSIDLIDVYIPPTTNATARTMEDNYWTLWTPSQTLWSLHHYSETCIQTQSESHQTNTKSDVCSQRGPPQLWRIASALETGTSSNKHPPKTDIKEYAEAVAAYIAKYTDNVTHCKTVTVHANQKPWLTGQDHRPPTAAFRAGDTTGLATAIENLPCGVRKTKWQYSKKISGPFSNNKGLSARSFWCRIQSSVSLLV